MRRRTGARVLHDKDVAVENDYEHSRNRAYYLDRIREIFLRQHKKKKAIVVDVDSDVDNPDCVETMKIASFFKFKLYNKNTNVNTINKRVEYHLVFIPV
jgi:hypothetical protein